ncbi:hypothetical protein JJQ60_15250 [Aquimarina mytili]|uniref:Uncharacterized protein n=1 Tax=Aquimarina mytili TaxID=874423 RepID=A0A936ZSN8_9FLAO|nr:hypothetical protein [Aquimarina mytili]
MITCLLFGVIAQANVNLRYYNKDSKTHKFEVKIAGSTKTVEFGSSRTASVTIQGGSEKAEIKTDCGWITVTNNSKIEIKDGCIVIK